MRLGGLQWRPGHCRGATNSQPEIEHRFLGCWARSLVARPTELNSRSKENFPCRCNVWVILEVTAVMKAMSNRAYNFRSVNWFAPFVKQNFMKQLHIASGFYHDSSTFHLISKSSVYCLFHNCFWLVCGVANFLVQELFVVMMKSVPRATLCALVNWV